MKKIMCLVLALALLCSLCACGSSGNSGNKDVQINANNLQNGGIVATDGTWVYYSNHGLYKMKLKNGEKQTIVSSDIYPDCLFCVNNKLYYHYYLGYYSFEDSTEEYFFYDPSSHTSERYFQTDGKKVYAKYDDHDEETGVFSAKLDDIDIENKTKISDIEPTELLLQGDYLYILGKDPDRNQGTWRIKTNGKNETPIFDYIPKFLVFSGDKIYYTNDDNRICSANLDGSDEMIVNDNYRVLNGLNVSDEYIFFISTLDSIYRMNKDGTDVVKLNDEESYKLTVLGDWIFYENQDDNNRIYKMSFDGSYNQPIY